MKRLKGFTLIEMVITIAIIVILSTISVPIYKDYIAKSKMAEGYVLLAAIRDAQLKYYNEYGYFLCDQASSIKSYNRQTCNEEVLGIDARTNKYFTWFTIGYWAYMGGGTNRYQFVAIANKPDNLRYNGNFLHLRYNITAGSTFYETN